MTKTVGITGGIGAGKSIICELLSTMGYPVFNSDKAAKALMNTTLKNEIVLLFGEQAYTKNTLNRAYISKQVFNDRSKLEALNSIVHPAVRKAFRQFTENSNSLLVFNEAAILFETGAYKNFDAIILVTASMETRINRVIKRDNTSAEEVKKRMNNQWTDERKSSLTPFVIENSDNTLIIPQTVTVLNHLSSS